LLIRRADREGDPWSGHMGFPGGHHEPDDASLRHTALRETYEELGVVLSDTHWVGRLDDVPTHRSGMVVRPFVFQVEQPPVVRPNGEVAEVLWASLDGLAAGRHDTEYPFDVRGTLHRFPAYDVEGRIVWGLTYRMLRVLLDLWQPTP
jgi:8-oxo-dGTP pyrophosphatase MutT (NUDIX family)